MAKYKISDTAILTDSGGERALVVNRLEYLSNLNITNTIKDLSPDYFINRINSFCGTVNGYAAGGTGDGNHIQKFPFASDANATDVGDLPERTQRAEGNSSATDGYVSGGDRSAAPYPTRYHQFTQRFSFANENNSSFVGSLNRSRYGGSGQSSVSHGYLSGGLNQSSSPITKFEKFPFAFAEGGSTDVGDLVQIQYYTAGHSSPSNGYISGGNEPAMSNAIQKFSFSVDANASDVGDLTIDRMLLTGQSSSTHGYASGGRTSNPSPPPSQLYLDTIDKFSFSADGNSTDVGNLSTNRIDLSGQSSVSNGYTCGGVQQNPFGLRNTIDKFPFSSDTNASDIADLAVAIQFSAGIQN